MEKDNKLRGYDYMFKSVHELANHPDFSQHAFRVVSRIMDMTTKELEELNLPSQRQGG